MPLKRGIVIASEVKKGDLIRMPGGFAPIEKVQYMLPETDLQVYNIALKTNEVGDEHHLLVADGIVTGDLYLQKKLQPKKDSRMAQFFWGQGLEVAPASYFGDETL